ncbi:MAG: (2Fe-2S)-binding protein [Pseudomonadota bacterium]
MAREIPIKFVLNGREYERVVSPNVTLVDFIRYGLGLTGTKKGCGQGECGSCTVLIDGQAVNACLVLAPQIHGKSLTTIEGLASRDEPHPLQTSFVEHSAGQCGFCTPGMILSAKALLDTVPQPNEQEVRRAISGNLCRCSGYKKITEAVLDAAERERR